MKLTEIRAAIVSSISDKLPSLKTCAAHGGRFDKEELQRIGTKAPAVFVSCLSFGGAEGETGETTAPVKWFLFIVTKDAPRQDKDELAMDMAEALVAHIVGNDWDLGGVAIEEPTQIVGQNLFSTELDKKGVAMWAVSFTQKMQLQAAEGFDTLDDLLRAQGEATNPGGDTLIETTETLEGASA